MRGAELRDLYQQVILDHARKPRNFGEPAVEGSLMAQGRNPLCGDNYRVFIDVADGVVAGASFDGEGCAISKASASLMTESLIGRSVTDAAALFSAFHELVTGEPSEAVASGDTNGKVELGKLEVFAGVCEFPSRVKCASLPWHAMHAALTASETIVTTESKRGDDD